MSAFLPSGCLICARSGIAMVVATKQASRVAKSWTFMAATVILGGVADVSHKNERGMNITRVCQYLQTSKVVGNKW